MQNLNNWMENNDLKENTSRIFCKANPRLHVQCAMSEDTDHEGVCVRQADAVDGIGGSVLRNHQADALAHTTW